MINKSFVKIHYNPTKNNPTYIELLLFDHDYTPFGPNLTKSDIKKGVERFQKQE